MNLRPLAIKVGLLQFVGCMALSEQPMSELQPKGAASPAVAVADAAIAPDEQAPVEQATTPFVPETAADDD